MWTKYRKKMHPMITSNVGASMVWRKMLMVRDETEHEIWWQLKSGNSSILLKNFKVLEY